jgi:hypothetical protein
MYYEIISIAYGSAADSDAGPRLLNDGKGSLRSDVLARISSFSAHLLLLQTSHSPQRKAVRPDRPYFSM